QKEYQEIRKKHSLFDITHDPELCAYVTRLPVENYDNDAAILFKDIMSPLPAIGFDVEIKAGVGPVIGNPVKDETDVEQIKEIDAERELHFVKDTIKLLTNEQLAVPFICFSGPPSTLASYMIEGAPPKTYGKTKSFMYP